MILLGLLAKTRWLGVAIAVIAGACASEPSASTASTGGTDTGGAASVESTGGARDAGIQQSTGGAASVVPPEDAAAPGSTGGDASVALPEDAAAPGSTGGDASVAPPGDAAAPGSTGGDASVVPPEDAAAPGGMGGDASVVPPEDAAAPDATGGAASDDSPCPALESYALSEEVLLEEVPAEGSGITWNWDDDTFVIVANLQGSAWEYDAESMALLRVLTLVEMDMDTEGVEYLGGGRFAIAAENNQVYVTRLDPTATEISGAPSDALVYQPSGPPPVNNAGFEGVAYRQPRAGAPGRFFVCQEYQPMRVVQFDEVADSELLGTRSPDDGSLVVEEPWDAEVALSGEVSDIAGMVYDERRDGLLIVSQESSVVIRVDPSDGAVTERLPLVDTSTSEGITLLDDCSLAVMSEPNRVQIYAPQGG